VRDKLCQILAAYGPSLHSDARRCENLLRDLCPQNKRELNVLIGALREGIPADLAAPAQKKTALGAIRRFSKRLEDNLALAEGPAQWAVESWALALKVVTPQELAAASKQHQPKPQPPVAPPPVVIARRQPSVHTRAIALTLCLVLVGTGVVLAFAWNRPAQIQRPQSPSIVRAIATALPAATAKVRSESAASPATVVPEASSTHLTESAAPGARPSPSFSPITDDEVAIVRGALFPSPPKVAADSER
jgi:hypothetical protein